MSQLYPVALIIEDEPNIRLMIKKSLESADFVVFEAATVARGLIESRTRQPDVVLLDLGLPDGSGAEVIDKIRAWSDVPIIVVSARSQETDKIAALAPSLCARGKNTLLLEGVAYGCSNYRMFYSFCFSL